jgi:hypothetical protein
MISERIFMKFFHSKTALRLFFILLLLITLYLLSCVLKVKSGHGIDQQEGLYWQEENSIDVMFLGTSHVHCDVNTGLLYDSYGITAYDYSGAEQPLWMTYYYLKELYRYQTPELLVLDLYGPARFKEDYQYTWISENIYGMRFSSNKLKMLLVSVEPGRIRDYFPSFAIYHNRYDSLSEDDFQSFFWNSEDKQAFKGYTPYFGTELQTEPDDFFTEEKGGLTKKSEKYLRKIIAYAKKKQTPLLLISAPYVITKEDKMTYNQIAEIAAQEDVAFIDFNEYYVDMGLDFTTDFNDESHLNYQGSCVFTDYLGKYLKENYDLADRRGDPSCESYLDNQKLILKEAKEASATG